jgi:hypothetical protein
LIAWKNVNQGPRGCADQSFPDTRTVG